MVFQLFLMSLLQNLMGSVMKTSFLRTFSPISSYLSRRKLSDQFIYTISLLIACIYSKISSYFTSLYYQYLKVLDEDNYKLLSKSCCSGLASSSEFRSSSVFQELFWIYLDLVGFITSAGFEKSNMSAKDFFFGVIFCCFLVDSGLQCFIKSFYSKGLRQTLEFLYDQFIVFLLLYKYNQLMTQNQIVQENQKVLESQIQEMHTPIIFQYLMTDLKGRKIATLIRFSKLNYILEETADTESKPHILKTHQGDLYEEYEIISFILNEIQMRSPRQSSFHKYSSNHDFVDVEPESRENSGVIENEEIVNLCGNSSFILAKMNEELFYLRKNLFPILDEFYKYLEGHEKVKKSKYDFLLSKIKKEVARLDQLMNDHSEFSSHENSFLNLIIVCELFLACKLVFEQKYRKSKYSLFHKCQKISKKSQFEDIFGKSNFCIKEYSPAEFEEEEQNIDRKEKDDILPSDMVKLSQLNLNSISFNSNDNRNELLYNFFKSTFKGPQPKQSYFPYYWMMYESLACELVEIKFNSEQPYSSAELEKQLRISALQFQKHIKSSIDYGFLGIYSQENEKDKHHLLQGIICLGSKLFEQFKQQLTKSVELKRFIIKKIDTTAQSERRKVQILFENQMEQNNFEGVTLVTIKQI